MQHPTNTNLTAIDLFAGIGGFHLAAKNNGIYVIFACEIDKYARKAYAHNHGLEPHDDATTLSRSDIPPHDILLAGFPCQPYSTIGERKGLDDERGGPLVHALMSIIASHRPKGIVLENVKGLISMSNGEVLQGLIRILTSLGYTTDYRVLNALDFGLPQRRERVFIVATLNAFDAFPWPTGTVAMTPLADVLEPNPPSKYNLSLIHI